MRSTIRSFCLGLLALTGMAAMAQNSVTVMGSVYPCSGTSMPVHVMSDPATVPPVDTIINTDADCNYSFTFHPTTTSGLFVIMASCDGGVSFGAGDTASYSAPLDTLVSNLSCGGGPANCQAAFTIQQAEAGGVLTAWHITTNNISTGASPMTYVWWLPDGSSSSAAEPTYTFTHAGVYGICLTITSGSCTSVHCDSVAVDTNGFISNAPVWYDCEGILWGTNQPGTPCDDGNPVTTGDTWTAGCICVGQGGGTLDCLGIPGGQNLPGAPCTDSTFFGVVTGIWNANCICQADSGTVDCLGIPGGTNLPGMECTDSLGNAGIWSGNCVCLADTSLMNCHAGFWTIQAYDSTSTGVSPIPNNVWVWNLSSGGNGNYQFLWNFGDGSSSTEAYPTHVYTGPGPWTLCLTMASGGCTDTYCDSVSVDANGILNGMAIEGHHADPVERSGGFTLNVIQSIPTGIAEMPAIADLRLWPNPVQDGLNLSFTNSIAGAVSVTVIDPNGRKVIDESPSFPLGGNTLLLNTGNLKPGLYMVRIGNATRGATHRFIKVR